MTHSLLSNEIVATVLGRVFDLVAPDVGRLEPPRHLEEEKENVEFKEFSAIYGVAFGLFWLCAIPYMTRHYEFHHPRRRHPACMQFLQSHQRSFEKFMSGNKPEAPPKPRQAFQATYQADRLHLYSQIFHSVIFKGHLMIVFVGTVALLLAWFSRNAEAVSDRARERMGFEKRQVSKESLIVGMECIARAQQIILPLASVVISLYVTYRIWSMHRAMDAAWKVQGSVHDVAILLGALLAPYRAEPGVREVLWTVHRHINLIHFFSYSNVCRDVSYVTDRLEMVSESGLLLSDETEQLGPEPETRIYSVFSWVLASIDRLVEVQLISQAYAPVVVERLGALQEATHALADEGRAESRPIMATLHMVRILGDAVTLLSPPALVHLFRSETVGVYFWSMFGSMVVALFYQGAVSLTKVLQNPFEDDFDGLNASWALMTTERKVFACLAGSDGTGGDDDGWPITPANLTELARKAVGGEKVSAIEAREKKLNKSRMKLISEIFHPVCLEGHDTKIFETPEDGWQCDVCGNAFHKGTHLFGCSICEWDICQSCTAEQQAEGLRTPPEEAEPYEEALPPPLAIEQAPVTEPSEITEDDKDFSEFDVADEMPPSEASVRGESYWDVGSEAGSLAISEGGPTARSLRPRSASRQFEFGVGADDTRSTSSLVHLPRENSNTPSGGGRYEPSMGAAMAAMSAAPSREIGLAPAMPVYNPSAAINLSRELLQATYVALREPREIILDEASLERLETVTTRPIAELASALIDVQGGGGTGKVFSGPLTTVAEEEDEGSPPPRDNPGPVMENGVLRDPAAPPPEQGQASQGERVILDLIGQFHSELQSASDLRSQAAAMQGGLVSRPPTSSQPLQQTSSRSIQSAQPRRPNAGEPDEIEV